MSMLTINPVVLNSLAGAGAANLFGMPMSMQGYQKVVVTVKVVQTADVVAALSFPGTNNGAVTTAAPNLIGITAITPTPSGWTISGTTGVISIASTGSVTNEMSFVFANGVPASIAPNWAYTSGGGTLVANVWIGAW